MVILIITSCSAGKDDSIPIRENSKIVEPSYYLEDHDLISQLEITRKRSFQDPRANAGTKVTYAFDLYVNAGKTYKDLRRFNYEKIKSILLSSNDIEWFFLSGGFGIIHALERARKYQATFNSTIAQKNNIPSTSSYWRNTLPLICDSVATKFNPEWTYVFGSKDYTSFIRQTQFWKIKNSIRMFESTGQTGPLWLSPILNELVNSILNQNLSDFNEKYPKFVKQQDKSGMG